MILQHIESENTSGVKYGVIFKIFLIIFLFFTSCKTTKKDNVLDQNSKSSIIDSTNIDQDPNSKNFDLFCGDRKIRIKGEDLNWTAMDYDILDCLVEKGFNGDEEANAQLSILIDYVGLNGFGSLFSRRIPEFRGERVFKSILKLSNNHEPRFTHDAEYAGTTKGLGFSGIYSKMISEIGGYIDLNKYVLSKSEYSSLEWVDINAAETSLQTYSKFKYEKVKEAYEANQIIFKPYGTK